jgi:hypothetical protein
MRLDLLFAFVLNNFNMHTEQDSSASSGSTEMMLGIGVSGGVILIECRISKALVN